MKRRQRQLPLVFFVCTALRTFAPATAGRSAGNMHRLFTPARPSGDHCEAVGSVVVCTRRLGTAAARAEPAQRVRGPTVGHK